MDDCDVAKNWVHANRILVNSMANKGSTAWRRRLAVSNYSHPEGCEINLNLYNLICFIFKIHFPTTLYEDDKLETCFMTNINC